MYLKAYGCDYDFLQFYLHLEREGSTPISIIMRYNSLIYVSSLCAAESECAELSAFLFGFEDCEIISGVKLLELSKSSYSCDKGFIMSYPVGDGYNTFDTNISMCNDSKVISKLVMQDESNDKYTDFYLNNSHLLRHGCLKAYIMYSDDIPVSVITVSDTDFDVSIVPTVYTHKHFRGNGFSKALLSNILCRNCGEYQLLCEAKNKTFYERCGFEAIKHWFHYKIRG